MGSFPLVAILEGLNDHENIGALFRNAAAFGVAGVLLDPTSADPLYRRSIRVSVGHVLRTPFARLTPWPAGLEQVRDAGFLIAAMTPRSGAATDRPHLAARCPRGSGVWSESTPGGRPAVRRRRSWPDTRSSGHLRCRGVDSAGHGSRFTQRGHRGRHRVPRNCGCLTSGITVVAWSGQVQLVQSPVRRRPAGSCRPESARMFRASRSWQDRHIRDPR